MFALAAAVGATEEVMLESERQLSRRQRATADRHHKRVIAGDVAAVCATRLSREFTEDKTRLSIEEDAVDGRVRASILNDKVEGHEDRIVNPSGRNGSVGMPTSPVFCEGLLSGMDLNRTCLGEAKEVGEDLPIVRRYRDGSGLF